MKLRPIAAAVLLFAASSCAAKDTKASPEKTAQAKEPNADPAEPIAKPSTERPRPPIPPLDTACQRDGDCGATQGFYEKDGACCRSCGTAVGTPKSIATAQKACGELGSEGCPLKKCSPPRAARCVEGQCTSGEARAEADDGGPPYAPE